MINTIYLDYGHGGIDTNNEYTTAPSKMFKLPSGTMMYEGQLNREIGLQVRYFLTRMLPWVEVIETAPGSEDVSLRKRIRTVNRGNSDESLLISIHNNASRGHNASGFELFTSVGETESDELARDIFKAVKRVSRSLKIRMRRPAKDLAREANFYVLRKSKCQAVLIEVQFFDYEADAYRLRDEHFQKEMARAIAQGIVAHITKQNRKQKK